jgi:hypothetical protein
VQQEGAVVSTPKAARGAQGAVLAKERRAVKRACTAAKAAGGMFLLGKIELDKARIRLGNASALLEALAMGEPEELDPQTLFDAIFGIKNVLDYGREALIAKRAGQAAS